MSFNNKYRIKVEAPLLRPGLTIETEVSEKYVEPVIRTIMKLVRLMNGTSETQQSEPDRGAGLMGC